jgi:hypothetical protein
MKEETTKENKKQTKEQMEGRKPDINKHGLSKTIALFLRETSTGQFKKKVALSNGMHAVKSPCCNTISPGDGGPKHFPASTTNKL